MKNKIIFSSWTVAVLFILSSCVQDLLDRPATTESDSSTFWKTVDDAESALAGTYAAMRPLFNANACAWDGAGEFVKTGSSWAKYNPGPIGGSFSDVWTSLFTVVNLSNNVIFNVNIMLSNEKSEVYIKQLERIKAEAMLMRAIVYFRLVDLWGDLPYITTPLKSNEEAYSLKKTPKYEIIDNGVLSDLTYAIAKLPEDVSASEFGRFNKLAAYGFRGKVQLYMACWMKNFESDNAKAIEYYTAAAADFKEIMKVRDTLFRNGEPGPNGEAIDKTLPNYFYLFQHYNETDPEIIASITFNAPGYGQGENFGLVFGTRSSGNGGGNCVPTMRLVNRYQKLSDGKFAEPVEYGGDENTPNGFFNTKTYEGRDLRMNATMLWEGQKIKKINANGAYEKYLEWRWGNTTETATLMNTVSCDPGYCFRKWMRDEEFIGTKRDDGPQDYYLLRLPDVWLMYAECVNEINNGPTDELFVLLDRIRHRGGLPNLIRTDFSTKETFFKAIEQERIVELVGEGHRFFDLRRWRMVEQIWNADGGITQLNNPRGELIRTEFQYATPRDYERYYIFQIPQSEVDKNPNLTQNEPWR